MAIDHVIVGDFFSVVQSAPCDDVTAGVAPLHERVRVTARVDVPFGRGHHHDASLGEIVAVVRMLAELRTQRVRRIDDP